MAHQVKKADQTSGALHNRRIVLQLLRRGGPHSRRQLAEETGLRSSTLTYIVRDLIASGVVHAVGKRESNRVGKKQVLLEINPDLGWVVGVGIDERVTSLVYMDAAGTIIDRDLMQIGRNPKLIPGLLKNRIESWVSRHGEPPGRLLGVGIGAPGVVDTDQHQILRSTWCQITQFRLGELVESELGVAVTLENDANCAALAESQVGSARDLRTFLFFLTNVVERDHHYAIRSFGSTLFLEGKLYRGRHFAAGEVDPLPDNVEEPADIVTEEQLLELANQNGRLDDSLEPIVRRLSTTLATLVDLLDPEAVILGGNLGLRNERVLEAIESEVNKRIVALPNRQVHIRPTTMMDQAVCLGAANAALDRALMDSELISPAISVKESTAPPS